MKDLLLSFPYLICRIYSRYLVLENVEIAIIPWEVSLYIDACACAGTHRRGPIVVKIDQDRDSARRVVTEVFCPSRWKFREKIHFCFISESGSGAPVSSGVPTSCANVIPCA
jgi:hypothetical protein